MNKMLRYILFTFYFVGIIFICAISGFDSRWGYWFFSCFLRCPVKILSRYGYYLSCPFRYMQVFKKTAYIAFHYIIFKITYNIFNKRYLSGAKAWISWADKKYSWIFALSYINRDIVRPLLSAVFVGKILYAQLFWSAVKPLLFLSLSSAVFSPKSYSSQVTEGYDCIKNYQQKI